MHRGTLWLGVGAAFLLLAAGCSPAYPKCDSDENCKEHNEFCVLGQCRECATDANCKTGFVCRNNACVPKPECTDDAACGLGRKCEAGKCVTKGCAQDADCGPNARCNNQVCAPNTCTANEDCRAGEVCQSGTCAQAPAGGAKACNWSPIHFGFDLSSLDAEARQQLDALAPCIRRAGLKKVVLEGNTDDRGTEEYNLQLSIRRAASVKKYLVDLGVASSILETVGYGKLRPAVQGDNEAAWAANRRVDFVYQ
ncbi:MAG TPA: OmpA family protein [Myxococcaceae bacterium]|jgi:peptidoglycan-associated lipoprotein|nr:OmpA family protein [Myxococcaceae bacterium]